MPYGAFSDTAAQGFYFDDLFYSVANQSAPATALAAYATGFEPPAIPATDLIVAKSHAGNFTQRQIGAQFTVTVTNSGTPSTIGVVTLTDNVPAGLTPTAASGSGWTCTVTGATVTCTRSDALAPTTSYPPVTITVNVAASAPASVTNTATVSGGGDANTTNNTATDVVTVLPGPPPGVTEIASFLSYDAAFPGGIKVAAGDVNGDGLADIITGAGPGGGPHVRIWSGANSSELFGFFAYNPAFPGGVSVAAGDVNGDGLADIITGAGPGGGPHVRVWNGADRTELFGFFAYNGAFPGGVNVAAADVNGDGLADIITGPGPGGEPRVRVWNGADRTELFGFLAYNSAFAGGVNVAAADVNGDGLADIITGPGPGGGPHVRIWNGAGGTELFGFFAYNAAFPGGVSVAAADFNGDGLADIITGAGPGGGPHVRIWSGADRSELFGFFAYNGAFPGGVNVAAADVNGDGVADVATGTGPGGEPHVRVFSVVVGSAVVARFFAHDPVFTHRVEPRTPW